MNITGHDKKHIRKWFGESEAGFRLIYQSAKDGLSGKAFHQKCDNQGPTVSVAFHTDGAVFGGYASESWNSIGSFIADSKAFLFHLRNDGNVEMVKKYPLVSQSENNALYGHPQYGPTFGNDPDLCLWKDEETLSDQKECSFTADSSQPKTFEGHQFDRFCRAVSLNEVLVYKIISKDSSDDSEDETPQWIKDGVKPWRKNKISWTRKYKQELLEEVESYTPLKNIKHVRFILFGLQGAGKSSFFNTIHSALKGRITKRTLMGSDVKSLTTQYRAFPLQSSSERSELKFQICDTMGLKENDGLKMSDVIHLLEGRLPDRYDFTSSEAYKMICALRWLPAPSDKAHCIGLVIDATSVDVIQGDCIEQYKTIIKAGHDRGIPTIALMTKIDLVCQDTMKDLSYAFCSKEVKDKVDTLADKLGITKNSVIPVKNYDNENDLEISCDILAFNALKQLQNFCDDYIEEFESGNSENYTLNICFGILTSVVVFLAITWVGL